MYILVLSISVIVSLYIPKQETAAKEAIVIPEKAIRLRILANSDSAGDQQLKRDIRDAVNEEIGKWVEDLTSMEEARDVIRSGLPELQGIVDRMLEERESGYKGTAEFGKVQFPTKLYGQFLYPAGEYEAVLITLGEGGGANWWCVLYPPLCFLDFSSGTAVSSPGFQDEQGKPAGKSQETEMLPDRGNMEEQQPAAGAEPGRETAIGEDGVEQTSYYRGEQEEEVEVRFLLGDLWDKWFN